MGNVDPRRFATFEMGDGEMASNQYVKGERSMDTWTGVILHLPQRTIDEVRGGEGGGGKNARKAKEDICSNSLSSPRTGCSAWLRYSGRKYLREFTLKNNLRKATKGRRERYGRRRNSRKRVG